MKRVKKSKNRIFGHFSHISFIISAWNGTFSRRSLSRHLFPLRSLQIWFFCDPHDIWELLEPNLDSTPPQDFFLYKYLAKGVLWPRPGKKNKMAYIKQQIKSSLASHAKPRSKNLTLEHLYFFFYCLLYQKVKERKFFLWFLLYCRYI